MYDSSYLLCMVPAFLLTMLAQWYVSSSYSRWSRVQNSHAMSGAEVARRLMQSNGLTHLKLEQVPGNLTDHYDPRSKTLRLSPGVAQGTSVAAAAIAAHELGHAVQDHENYPLLRLRSAMVPAVSIGSNLGWILLMVGLFMEAAGIAWLGVLTFSGGALFALATLPVELDASRRARVLLANSGIINNAQESGGVSNVLNAAALTYVAALAGAISQLLYYASIVMGMNRRS
ncbi:MAG: zinc metallopeptidase [Anaerolineales bacterium]|nr:zinc metallopeptidase [Anaerolineales bacterium]MCW5854697.1 zinc metallopeptidase [Anaerolineales bacterium]MCW5878379.1 zinc metallopeptidase [Anaerolineales bacterium]